MTINVAVVTAEALVLGCDSIASATQYLVNPFKVPYERLQDGSLRLTVGPEDLSEVVTDTWDGVTKMFALSDRDTPVAAVTAGLARLNDRSMSSYANQFFHECQHGEQLRTVGEVAERFLRFIRDAYESHYASSNIPEEFHSAPVFLLGGYSASEHFPSLYRIDVQDNKVVSDYSAGQFGLSWQGQSDAVECLMRGYDTYVRASVESQITAGIEALRSAMGEAAAGMLQQVLDQTGVPLPSGVNTELPTIPPFKVEWDEFRCTVAYSNLPLQDAIDLASYLVGLQSGKAKFTFGVATVGGRTHIGIITRRDGLRMIGEPELHHTNVGFVS